VALIQTAAYKMQEKLAISWMRTVASLAAAASRAQGRVSSIVLFHCTACRNLDKTTHLVDEDGGVLGGSRERGAGPRVAAEHQAPARLPRQRDAIRLWRDIVVLFTCWVCKMLHRFWG